ncbi:MAG: ABC transporter substrate-binding protein [Alphaproteobacteria bacterium]|nr:ABC transporter substrate-binding protein [Alphaproteobacteria bacterium]
MKKKNKKFVIGAATIAIVAVAALLWGGVREVSSDKPIVKIGVIGPMSGDMSTMGTNCRQAIEFALSRIENSPVQFKLIVEDDGYMPARAAMAANKLVSVDRVNALITCSAISDGSAATIANRSGTPLIAVNSSVLETATSGKYGFLHWSLPAAQAKKSMQLLRENNVRRMVSFVLQHPGAIAIHEGLLEAAKGEIDITTISFVGTERNFGPIVDKAMLEKPDMLMILTVSPTADLLMRVIGEKRITTPITSIEVPNFVENKSIFEGMVFVDAAEGDAALITAYKSKFKTDNTYGVAYAYDATMIFARVFGDFWRTHGRIADSDEVVEAIRGLTGYVGAVGAIKVLPNNLIESEAAIKKVVDGKVVVIE